MRTLRRADALEIGDVIALPENQYARIKEIHPTAEGKIKLIYRTADYLGMRTVDAHQEGTILTPEEPEARKLLGRLPDRAN